MIPTHKTSTMWQGAFLKVLACLLFALVNTIVRYLTNYNTSNPLHFSQIVFVQNVVGVIIMGHWIFTNLKGVQLKKKRTHFLRIIFAIFGLCFWYASLSFLPIAHAIALSFTNPIFTIIFAKLLLEERFTKLRTLSIIISFCGAFFIMQPKFSSLDGININLQALLPLLSASFFAGTKITGRILAKNGESARIMTSVLLLFMVPATLLPALYYWQPMNLAQIGLVTLLGLLSTMANITLAKSYAYAEISFLSPFGFTKLFFGALFGYLFFSELPKHSLTWVGILLILLSIFILSLDEKKKKEIISLDLVLSHPNKSL